jgi:SAM-dependent methyltransferase
VAVIRLHVPWYEDVFRIDGLLAEPLLVFGMQPMWIDPIYFVSPLEAARTGQLRNKLARHAKDLIQKVRGLMPPTVRVPRAFQVANLNELLANRGLTRVVVLDLFDPRADLQLDMNVPVPVELHDSYATMIDIGSIEHVFDTRQCIENCLRLVKPGGFYFVVAPVKGWFGHGLHTFHPAVLIEAARLNGFDIVYERYTTIRGQALDNPAAGEHVLLWMVARKTRAMSEFIVPQQGGWVQYYSQREDGTLVKPNA